MFGRRPALLGNKFSRGSRRLWIADRCDTAISEINRFRFNARTGFHNYFLSVTKVCRLTRRLTAWRYQALIS